MYPLRKHFHMIVCCKYMYILIVDGHNTRIYKFTKVIAITSIVMKL